MKTKKFVVVVVFRIDSKSKNSNCGGNNMMQGNTYISRKKVKLLEAPLVVGA